MCIERCIERESIGHRRLPHDLKKAMPFRCLDLDLSRPLRGLAALLLLFNLAQHGLGLLRQPRGRRRGALGPPERPLDGGARGLRHLRGLHLAGLLPGHMGRRLLGRCLRPPVAALGPLGLPLLGAREHNALLLGAGRAWALRAVLGRRTAAERLQGGASHRTARRSSKTIGKPRKSMENQGKS